MPASLHAPRRRILAALRERPGLTKAGLARHLGIPATTLGHHLAILQRAGLVTCVHRPKETYCGLAGLTRDEVLRHGISMRPLAALVCAHLRTVKQASVTQIAAALAVPRKAVTREVGLLLSIRSVEGVGSGRPRYRLLGSLGDPAQARSAAASSLSEGSSVHLLFLPIPSPA